MSKFFITTAIDYTNGAPHLGHAYEKVLADVLARYHRLKSPWKEGEPQDVFFLTGVDQHGQKVQQSAAKAGMTPQEFVDEVTAKFVALWDKLEVRYDRWAATTDASHKEQVRTILQRLWDDKDPATGESRWIYKSTRGGHYSVRQEQFLTEKERGPDGQFGPQWGEVEYREEENYYFRLEGSSQWLLDLISRRSEQGRPLVVPELRQAELVNAARRITGDLCISRPKARLGWGIELPFDPDYVTFVWFDALANYVTFAPGYDPSAARQSEEFLAWWRRVLHVIGKDILIPAHGIYWPIMLHALGFADDEMPTFLVHGWWNVGGEKMSKSLGNSVDPDELADRYGAEALRYYLMSDIATGRDADFSEERLRDERYNKDLANNLGNLLNRTLSMAQKYRAGKLVRHTDHPHPRLSEYRHFVTFHILQEQGGYRYCFEQCKVDAALGLIRIALNAGNELIQQTAPWKLAKDADQQDLLDAVLYHLAESLRIAAILISPVLPTAAHGIFDQLNWKTDLAGKEQRFCLDETSWGGLPDGHIVSAPTPLFPRIEVKPAAA